MKEIILSFCIPTFNRADKLDRLLRQLSLILKKSQFSENIEILISNNGSSDNTEEIVGIFLNHLNSLCKVRSYKQIENIGMCANWRFLYEQAKGRYVWIFSDDDILYEEEFDRLIIDLLNYQPEVCISSFRQPPMTEENRIFMCGGKPVELITEPKDGVEILIKYPKLPMYVYKHYQLTESEKTIVDRGVITAYWFITLAIFLFLHKERKLLVRSENIARCDDDYLNLRYSPSVFSTLKDAVLIGINEDEVSYHFKNIIGPDIDNTIIGLLFRHCLGKIKLDSDVVTKDFEYVKQNWSSLILSGWRNFIKVIAILIFFPLIKENLSKP